MFKVLLRVNQDFEKKIYYIHKNQNNYLVYYKQYKSISKSCQYMDLFEKGSPFL